MRIPNGRPYVVAEFARIQSAAWFSEFLRIQLRVLPGADKLFKSVEDLGRGHAVGIDFDRIGRFAQAAKLPVEVVAVSFALFFKHLSQGDLFAADDKVVESPHGADFVAGGEIDFALRPREGDGGLVAAFGDNVLAGGQFALQVDQQQSHLPIVGGVARERRDF